MPLFPMFVNLQNAPVLLVGGGWMMETLLDFARYLFTLM